MWQQCRKSSDLSNNQILLSDRENKHRCFLLVTYLMLHLKSSLAVSLSPYCFIFLQLSNQPYIVSCIYSSAQFFSSLSSCPSAVLCLALCSSSTILCCLSTLLSVSLCSLLPYIISVLWCLCLLALCLTAFSSLLSVLSQPNSEQLQVVLQEPIQTQNIS